MDRATRLRMGYTAMLLKRYQARMEDPAALIDAFEADLADPRRAQGDTLRGILERNADTEYGRRFGFAEISSPEEYRAALPVVDYEDLRPSIDRMLEGERDVLVAGAVSYFSVTSGSTAAPKFLPGVQQAIVNGCEAMAARNAYLLRDHPQACAGRALFVVGSVAEGVTSAGVSYGAMTGFGYHAGQVGFAGPPFPYGVFTLKEYAARYHCLLRLALATRDLSAIMVYNPSTLLLLLERARRDWDRLVDEIAAGGPPSDLDLPAEVAEELAGELAPDPERAAELRALGPDDPRAWWPRLSLLACWKGGTLGFYLRELERLLGDLPVRDLGILASEAMVTVPVDDVTPGGVLLPRGAFFELVPAGGTSADARFAWEVEEGATYRLILTTPGGLYRYDLADMVRVEGFHGGMPLLSFLHRAGRVHSFTGEKLTEHQVTVAVRAAADDAGLRLAGFMAVPAWGLPPRYELRAELAAPAGSESCRRFARALDRELGRVNVEYVEKRRSGRLGAAGLALVAPGGFAELRRRRSREDAQYKEIHLAAESEAGPDLTSALPVTERIA